MRWFRRKREAVDVTAFAGFWVALHSGRVIAVANSPHEIVERLGKLGDLAIGATIVHPTADTEGAPK